MQEYIDLHRERDHDRTRPLRKQAVWRSEVLAGLRDRIHEQEEDLIIAPAYIDDFAFVMGMMDLPGTWTDSADTSSSSHWSDSSNIKTSVGPP